MKRRCRMAAAFRGVNGGCARLRWSGRRATRLTSADWRSALRTAPRGRLTSRQPCAGSSTCARALVWPPACPFEPPWSPLPPRMRCAAALSRSPTPLVFGLAASFSAAASSALRGLYSLPTSSTCATSAAVAAPEADAQDARVAARPLGEPRRDRLEQLADDRLVRDLGQDHPPRVQRLAVGVAGRDAALGDGDQPLDERPQLLRLRHRRLDPLVAQQRSGLVAQQRQAMLRDAAEFPVCDVVSHGEFEGAG